MDLSLYRFDQFYAAGDQPRLLDGWRGCVNAMDTVMAQRLVVAGVRVSDDEIIELAQTISWQISERAAKRFGSAQHQQQYTDALIILDGLLRAGLDPNILMQKQHIRTGGMSDRHQSFLTQAQNLCCDRLFGLMVASGANVLHQFYETPFQTKNCSGNFLNKPIDVTRYFGQNTDVYYDLQQKHPEQINHARMRILNLFLDQTFDPEKSSHPEHVWVTAFRVVKDTEPKDFGILQKMLDRWSLHCDEDWVENDQRILKTMNLPTMLLRQIARMDLSLFQQRDEIDWLMKKSQENGCDFYFYGPQKMNFVHQLLFFEDLSYAAYECDDEDEFSYLFNEMFLWCCQYADPNECDDLGRSVWHHMIDRQCTHSKYREIWNVLEHHLGVPDGSMQDHNGVSVRGAMGRVAKQLGSEGLSWEAPFWQEKLALVEQKMLHNEVLGQGGAPKSSVARKM